MANFDDVKFLDIVLFKFGNKHSYLLVTAKSDHQLKYIVVSKGDCSLQWLTSKKIFNSYKIVKVSNLELEMEPWLKKKVEMLREQISANMFKLYVADNTSDTGKLLF